MGNCFLNTAFILLLPFLSSTSATKWVTIQVEESPIGIPWSLTFCEFTGFSGDGKVLSCNKDAYAYYDPATERIKYPLAEHNSHGTRPILVMELAGKPIMVYNEPYFGESPHWRLRFPEVYFGDWKGPFYNCLDKLQTGFPDKFVLQRDYNMVYNLHTEYLWKPVKEQRVGNRPHKQSLNDVVESYTFKEINIETDMDQHDKNPLHVTLHTSKGLSLQAPSHNMFDLKTKQRLKLWEHRGNPRAAVIQIHEKEAVIMVYSPVHLGEKNTTLILKGDKLYVNGEQVVIDLGRKGQRWPSKEVLLFDYEMVYGRDATYVHALTAPAAR